MGRCGSGRLGVRCLWTLLGGSSFCVGDRMVSYVGTASLRHDVDTLGKSGRGVERMGLIGWVSQSRRSS